MPSIIKKECCHKWYSFSLDGSCQKCATCELIRMIDLNTKEISYIKNNC